MMINWAQEDVPHLLRLVDRARVVEGIVRKKIHSLHDSGKPYHEVGQELIFLQALSHMLTATAQYCTGDLIEMGSPPPSVPYYRQKEPGET